MDNAAYLDTQTGLIATAVGQAASDSTVAPGVGGAVSLPAYRIRLQRTSGLAGYYTLGRYRIAMKAEELIGQYLLAAAEHWAAQREVTKRSALVRGNRAADELRRLATMIGQGGSEYIRAFSALLDESRNGVNGWAGFHILEVMDAPPDVVDRAFETLEGIARGDGMNALGTRMRLKELRARFARPSPD
ncbi:MAG TPA: hypothetical protein VM364_19530 [Vicinamibacterales bacterium]|nr:hypothetical protein [Vicinamibacterales bacterium]